MDRKKTNKNHSHNSLLSPKSPEKKWGINFGNIKSKHPLNCGDCGGKKMEYRKKRADLWAECRDCGGKFQVSPALAPFLFHLVGEVGE
ncbi:hypothetical protein NIES2119_31640 [[Phormidium ambiguum] IAM M-71]|uniref:Uncharacterized protein n=1 Tax=[Phormidium ambiguum] IAM M-71 TaxID=454136 RepID=A0A1U7I1X3_9CYAN|nr:hypothetical protein NIES2119_31640 [Phormidium ambiguum IAM M-71]